MKRQCDQCGYSICIRHGDYTDKTKVKCPQCKKGELKIITPI